MTPNDLINEIESSIDGWTNKEVEQFETRVKAVMNRPRLMLDLNHKVISYLGYLYIMPVECQHDKFNLPHIKQQIIEF